MQGTTLFIGSRPRTREVLQRKMYTNEITEWITEAKLEERQNDITVINNYVDSREGNDISDSELVLHRRSRSPQRNGVCT